MGANYSEFGPGAYRYPINRAFDNYSEFGPGAYRYHINRAFDNYYPGLTIVIDPDVDTAFSNVNLSRDADVFEQTIDTKDILKLKLGFQSLSVFNRVRCVPYGADTERLATSIVDDYILHASRGDYDS